VKEKRKFDKSEKILLVPGLPGTGPGTARQRKLGQGREGRKEGKEREGKERACGAERSGPAARMDGWIDGQRREQEASGGREGWGWGAGKIRRGKATKESHGQQWLQFVLLIAHGEG